MAIANRKDAAEACVAICAAQSNIVGTWETLIAMIIEMIMQLIEQCTEDETEWVDLCRNADAQGRQLERMIRVRLRRESGLGIVQRIIASRQIADSLTALGEECSEEELKAVYAG